MSSYTVTEARTFTVTDARKMAAKVAADLKRMQRFYGSPSDSKIADYEQEVVELLKAGYLGTVTYGYRRDGNWIVPTLRYTAQDLVDSAVNDDDPGRVKPDADISGASFYNFLTYNDAWSKLSPVEQEAVTNRHPVRRREAPEPGVTGYMVRDKTYSSGGRALQREIVKEF